MTQRFGGAWTEEKLECLKKYFRAYQAILKKNTDFPLIYIDAFAGTGVREDPEGAQIYREGSALIALRDGGFDEYWLAESDPRKTEELRNRVEAEFPRIMDRVKIFTMDGNNLIQEISRQNWSRKRALMFLDPFGTQVKWSTMESIAATKAMDLWTLVPVGTLNRLLCNEGVRPEYRALLDRFFGNSTWEAELYKERYSQQMGLFEPFTDSPTLKVPHQAVGAYYLRRLSETFAHVCGAPLILKNSTGSP